MRPHEREILGQINDMIQIATHQMLKIQRIFTAYQRLYTRFGIRHISPCQSALLLGVVIQLEYIAQL